MMSANKQKPHITLPDIAIPKFVGVLLDRTGMNFPVFLALLTQGIHFVNGIVLVLLISQRLSLEAQGFYYTFGSLAAIQLILDLDFQSVALVIASHEWSKLSLDEEGRIVGDPDALSRLCHQTRISILWYGVSGLIATLIIWIVGYLLMSRQPTPSIDWQVPWLSLVALNGMLLCIRALTVIVEGCNQVVPVNKFRLYESLARALALWLILLIGGGLWAPAGAALVSVLWTAYFLATKYRIFFESFITPPKHARIDWKNEIWPIQWRMGLSGVLLYLVGNSLNPLMFYYYGSAVAGKTGMTLALVTALQSAAMAWLTPRRPLFGVLVANRDYANLDRTWFRTTSSSVITLVVVGLAAWLLIVYMNTVRLPLAQRFLDPLPIIAFIGWATIRQISFGLTVYLRAHKQDPTAVISVVGSVASVVVIWRIGAAYGPAGASIALLGVSGLCLVGELFVWKTFRNQWHGT